MRERITIADLGELHELEARVRTAADGAVRALAELVAHEEPLGVLHALKFRPAGFHPLHPERAHNLLEQVHQTFAYLAALRAVEHLLRRHPEHAPYHLNLGTSAVPDVESADGAVVAEVFAGLSVRGNRKVEADLERLRAHPAPLCYFVYHAAEPADWSDPDIEAVAVDL